MAYITKASEGQGFEPIEAGTYIGRCYGIVGLGTHDTEYQGQKRKRRTVRVLFELPTELRDFGKGEEPVTVGKTYTDSLGGGDKPSALRVDLEAWRGRPFTPEELAGFDISKLLGVPCTLTISHKAKTGGGVAAIVSAVGKVMKGQTCPPAVLKTVCYAPESGDGGAFKDLPEWMQKEIRASYEFQDYLKRPADHADVAPAEAAPADDIPF